MNTNNRVLLLALSALTLASCGGAENSDGSKRYTYSSCSITDSGAVLASDRAKDMRQCWDGVNYEEQSTAMRWCGQKVSSYISREYTFGHSVEYLVASTNCPQIDTGSGTGTSSGTGTGSTPEPTGLVKYSVKVKVNSHKSGGSSWDGFGGAPDVKIYIDGEYKGKCQDSFNCNVEHTSIKKEWTISLIDADAFSDDTIGRGKCRVNTNCIVGQATVNIQPK
jgi:hypothetical protein